MSPLNNNEDPRRQHAATFHFSATQYGRTRTKLSLFNEQFPISSKYLFKS